MLELLDSGSHIIALDDVYGGTGACWRACAVVAPGCRSAGSAPTIWRESRPPFGHRPR
ncbi:hypothetical protein O0544_18595 [Edwardsiella anguillarum]|nr:hypothetical protein [Edwardsiella anguillarum]